MTSELLKHIEILQAGTPWGSFLDAGTGTHSIKWVSSLKTERWTAVTGAEGHAVQVRDVVEKARRPQDRIVLGNWADPNLLLGERYDTVLADYLLGAIDGFAPFFQDRLFFRLKEHVGRRLYVIGLEPYVTTTPTDPDGKLVCEIGRFRDACLLLAGERPYREYPAEWAIEHLEAAGFRVLSAKHFNNRYKERFVNSQIDMCAPRLAKLRDPALALALQVAGEEIRARALAHIDEQGALKYGADYILAAEPHS
jgi:hypothetical protein